MTWKPIVAGVDSSAEAARAAAVAAHVAEAGGTSCQLVHVTGDQWSALAIAELPERAKQVRASILAQGRERVQRALLGVVPPNMIHRMIVRIGRAAAVLKQVAAEQGAELVVLGGKHHSVVERWLAGSTSLDMLRTTDLPLLVMGDSRAPIRRVLAAVDRSAAARPTIEAAERFGALLSAEVRVLCALEPVPVVPEAPNYDLTHYYAMLEDQIEHEVWPLVASPEAARVTRHGTAVDAILREAAEWRADVVVVGSHGKGWVDRLLIGSVTERLLNRLPTSLLIVPVYAAVAADHASPRPRHEEILSRPSPSI